MGEVTGAVIATALVLVAVFVPVAFFPGHDRTPLSAVRADDRRLDGDLGVQRADADAGAGGAAARRRSRSRRACSSAASTASSTAARRCWCAVLRGLVRVRAVVALVFVAAARRDLLGLHARADRVRARRGPGLLFILRAGAAGRVARLHDEHREAGRADHRRSMPEVEPHVRRRRLQLRRGGAEPGHHVRAAEGLRPSGRGDEHSAKAVVGQLFGAFSQITGAMVIPFLPPSIQGLGQFGGFPYELLDQSGGPIEDLAAAAQQLIGAGQPDAGPDRRSSRSSPPTIRSSSSTIDREQAKSLGVSLGDITDTMQMLLGLGVRERLRLQQPRRTASTCRPTSSSASKPERHRALLRAHGGGPDDAARATSSSVREATAPKSINHFNLFRSAEINGSAAPGFSSGQALQAMAAAVGPRAAAGHDVRVVGAVARGDQGRAASRRRSSASACCSST